jgi:hypothetical protein
MTRPTCTTDHHTRPFGTGTQRNAWPCPHCYTHDLRWYRDYRCQCGQKSGTLHACKWCYRTWLSGDPVTTTIGADGQPVLTWA